jgi:3-phenylpropionate/cinnamic acid dioxygenase small subunit
VTDVTDDLATTVAWLRDRELIKALPQRYARNVDKRDWKAVRACFADDCYVKGTIAENPVDAYMEGLAPGVEAYEATMHFMGNQYIDLEPGADTAFVETYAVAYHLEAPDTGLDDLFMGVRYCDDVRRDGADWIIAKRQVFLQWNRGPLPRPTTS